MNKNNKIKYNIFRFLAKYKYICAFNGGLNVDVWIICASNNIYNINGIINNSLIILRSIK